jgi:hypothetical protein
VARPASPPGTPPGCRWRIVDLCRIADEKFGVTHRASGMLHQRMLRRLERLVEEPGRIASLGLSVLPQTLSRELRAMGCRKLSARPKHHAQDTDALKTFKKLPLRQLAVKPHLPRPRRHRRSLLPALETPRRAAMDHHVHPTARVSAWVLVVSGSWYYPR